MATWGSLMAVRDQVNAALEDARQAKLIGNALGARVTLEATGRIGTLLEQHRSDLPALFIVSDVVMRSERPDAPDHITVVVDKAPGVKCARCWRFVPAVRTEPDWAGICDRCVDALTEPVAR
jgi:isoleucyl-tRNA synthetase